MDKKTIKDLLLIAYAHENYAARAFLQDFGGLDDQELEQISEIADEKYEAALERAAEAE